MKNLICLLFLVIPVIGFSQKKIDNKIFLYGNVTDQVHSTVLIKFADADPKTDLKTVKFFEKEGVNAMSWNNIFLPGAEYTHEEFNSMLNENRIYTIVIISLTDKSKTNYSYSTTDAYASAFSTDNGIHASGSSSTRGGTISYTRSMALKLDVFTRDNNFAKPKGVIMGEASGNAGVYSSERSIARKIIGRMLDGLVKENAFPPNVL